MKRKTSIYIAVIGLFIALAAAPASAAWSTSTSKDPSSGDKMASAYSDNAKANKNTKGNLEAWLGVGCTSGQEWAYVGFSDTPKFANTKGGVGYEIINAQVKWDGKAEDVTLTQDPGSNFVHFRDDAAIINGIARSYAAEVVVDLKGEGQRSFKISLGGSSAALKNIRRVCRGR